MGCWNSRLVEREETVARCRARKRYIKQLLKARRALSAAHAAYLRSLRSTGATLLRFATAETSLLRPAPPSPTSWTAASPAAQPPSTWDFWDPFVPTSGRSADEEEWEETTTDSEATATATATPTTTTMQSMAAPPSVVTATAAASGGEVAVVVSAKSKDLIEIMKEVDDYFLKAAGAGGPLSVLLEVPTPSFNRQTTSGKEGYEHLKGYSPLLWALGSVSAKRNVFGKLCEDKTGNNSGSMATHATLSHSSTIARLCAWEKKLYDEVKNGEYLKLEHKKKAALLRKLEMRSADFSQIENAQKEADKLETRMLVNSQAIETTSAAIIKLRETELYQQLVELVKGLMNMWRSMYEFHQVQTHIVQQLKYLSCFPSTDPTSEIHRQSTLQLELQAQQWLISFSGLMRAHRDYIHALTGWLRLSLFQVGNNSLHKTTHDSAILSLCEEWQLAINNAPVKMASEGIKSFLTMIHAIVVQQAQEQKQKKRSESAFRYLEKKATQLRSLESKHGPHSASTCKDPVRKLRAKVDALRAKAEDEKGKYEKSASAARALTMNNLQMELPHVFQAMTSFASVCAEAFESVHNQAKSTDDLHNMRMILP